jgi:peptidoglycan hydrolase-like protein with peptidoglycan-binding domain
MVRKAAGCGLILGMLVLSGCATVSKNELSNQELRNKISLLEAQLSEKDNEINSLKEMAKIEPVVMEEVDQNSGRLNVKQIQTALTNAGYFDGVIDGKMGKKTRRAIRAFQKANNLQVDGQVGKNTAAALMEYLNKKVK